MKTSDLFAILAVIIFFIGAWYVYAHSPSLNSSSTSSSNAEDTVVRQVVTEFGSKLQMVSLLAPQAARKAAMDANYGAYVAPELLAQWYPEGADALGRSTSSPWPQKIDIVDVRQEGTQMIVEGNVIEVTATQAGSGQEAAAVYPVTLTLEKRNGAWLIVAASKGAYSELPQRQTIVGFWECLPHKHTKGPQTDECALGIAVEASDGHYAVDTSLMSTYPVDFPTGTKIRVSGIVTPANQLSSIQKYDIDGVIRATTIEKI